MLNDLNGIQTILKVDNKMKEAIDHGTEGFHESIMRSYQILEDVKIRLKRGDSKETIMDLIEFYERQGGQDET